MKFLYFAYVYALLIIGRENLGVRREITLNLHCRVSELQFKKEILSRLTTSPLDDMSSSITNIIMVYVFTFGTRQKIFKILYHDNFILQKPL